MKSKLFWMFIALLLVNVFSIVGYIGKGIDPTIAHLLAIFFEAVGAAFAYYQPEPEGDEIVGDTHPATPAAELLTEASQALKADAGGWLREHGYPDAAQRAAIEASDPDGYLAEEAPLRAEPDPSTMEGPCAPGTVEQGPHGPRTY